MSRPVIHGFAFDDANEAEMARHGLTPRRVLQVLEDEIVILPNRKGRTALYLLIGRDRGGACITVPIEPTHDHATWRPVTAWYSKDHEKARLEGR